MFIGSLIDKFKDNQQSYLTITTTLIFAGCIAMLFFKAFPPESEKILTLLIGAVGAKWGDLISYYFGSSAGSAKKTDLMAAKKEGDK